MSRGNLGLKYLQHFLEGVDRVVNVVATTHGVNGGHIFISDGVKQFITNDGVTVAEYFNEDTLGNFIEKMGAKFVKDTLRQIDVRVKNGTTTGSLIISDLIKEYVSELKLLKNNKKDKIMLERELKNVLDIINDDKFFDNFKIKKDENDTELLDNVLYSSCRDKEMAGFIKDIISDKDLIPIVDWKKSKEYKIEKTIGSKFNFVKMNNINIDKIPSAGIIVLDGKVNSVVGIKSFVGVLSQEKKDSDIIIICREFDENIIPELGSVEEDLGCSITFYAMGQNFFEECEDLNNIISFETLHLMNISALYHNSVHPIILEKDGFNITKIDDGFNNEKRQEIVDNIMLEISDSSNFKSNNRKMKRISKYLGYKHLISVKSDDTNLDSQYDKFTDTINTGKNFINSDYYAVGGGVFYKDVGLHISNMDFETGAGDIIMMGLNSPYKNISKGIDGYDSKEMDNKNWGLNALSFDFGDMSNVLIDDLRTNIEVLRITLKNFVNIVVQSNGALMSKEVI